MPEQGLALSCKESLKDLGADVDINVNSLESLSLDRLIKRGEYIESRLKKFVRGVAVDRKKNSFTVDRQNKFRCIRLAHGKFELTNQDSAGWKNFTVVTSL